MVSYNKFQLDNGLRVIVHEDKNTALAIVNLLYDVGSRDEDENKTGFAHLFEHLMFKGSKNVKSFDQALNVAGGESNAFTSTDMTNYYDLIPANNLETAFWLESDRMLSLNFSTELLEKEKEVVSEEFKENYINQPYGNAMHELRKLAYKVHPYKWPVIGKDLSHIQEAKLTDVQSFFDYYYTPNNAILVVAGGVKTEEVRELAQKWFGNIKANPKLSKRSLPKEPPQQAYRQERIEANVPVDALYMAFHICDRLHPDYHTTDLLVEVLSGGTSSRLYQSLILDQKLFNSLLAHHSGGRDESLIIVNGKLNPGVSIEQAEAAVWEQLERFTTEEISQRELQKVINKVESSFAFSEVSIGNKAFYLAYFELLGNIDHINNEIDKYRHVTSKMIQQVAKQVFRKENCSSLHYVAKNK